MRILPLPLTLAGVFLKTFLRDRQAIFFSLFFPIVFMLVFGFISDDEPETIDVAVVAPGGGELARRFIASLEDNPLFRVTRGEEGAMREAVIAGDATLALMLPEAFTAQSGPAAITVLVDAAQARQLALIMPVLEQGLVKVERDLRGIEPLFTLEVEDVQARSQRYIDFLVPGLLAFTLMQLSVAGSGFNIVEYRRKGILKRLFVTPLAPRDFISALVLSRSLICLAQLSILLAIAILLLDVRIVGGFLSLYTVIVLGTAIFLCLGFCIGSLARSQQSVMAMGNIVIFPQIFLAGVFYPIDALPALLQPLAALLPLSFVVNGLREIVVNGLALPDIVPDLVGMLVWLAVALLLAIRLFDWKEVAA